MYYSNKFNGSLFTSKLPTYYSDINSDLINSMIAFLAYKQFGNKIFEKSDFSFNFNYVESVYSINEDIILSLDNYESSLVVLSYIPKGYVDLHKYGYTELNTPECPISRYLTEEETTHNDDEKKFLSVYSKKQTKSIILISNKNITTCDILRFFSASVRIWDWIFSVDGLSKDEEKLFKEMSKKHKNSEWFAPLIDKLYPYEAERIDIETKLKDYSLCGIKNEIENLEYSIGNLNSSINRCIGEINRYLDEKTCKTQMLLSLKNSAAVANNSVYDFFNNLKEISIKKINLGRYPEMSCAITSTLEFYDKDLYESIYKNPTSYINQFRYKDIVDVMHALFQHNKGKLVVQSEFTLCGLSSVIYHSYSECNPSDYVDCMPTPHIGFYKCLGGNETPILKYLSEGQWDMAIYQILSATKNINFADSCVVNSLMNHLQVNLKKPFILADNGKKMTVLEFINYIREDKKK